MAACNEQSKKKIAITSADVVSQLEGDGNIQWKKRSASKLSNPYYLHSSVKKVNSTGAARE